MPGDVPDGGGGASVEAVVEVRVVLAPRRKLVEVGGVGGVLLVGVGVGRVAGILEYYKRKGLKMSRQV